MAYVRINRWLFDVRGLRADSVQHRLFDKNFKMAGSRTVRQLPSLGLFILLSALFFQLLRADKRLSENSLDFAQATALQIEEAIQVGTRPSMGSEEIEGRSNLVCKKYI